MLKKNFDIYGLTFFFLTYGQTYVLIHIEILKFCPRSHLLFYKYIILYFMYISCFVFRSAPVLIAVKQIFLKILHIYLFWAFKYYVLFHSTYSISKRAMSYSLPCCSSLTKNIVFIHLIPVQSCTQSISSQQQDVSVHTVQPFFNVIVLKSTKDLGKKK